MQLHCGTYILHVITISMISTFKTCQTNNFPDSCTTVVCFLYSMFKYMLCNYKMRKVASHNIRYTQWLNQSFIVVVLASST